MRLLGFLNNFFQVLAAKLKNEVLHLLSLLVLAVVNVEHLDAIFAISESFEHLKLSTHVFACLGSSLNCNLPLAHIIVSFENVAYTSLKP